MSPELLAVAAQIVSAHVANNKVSPEGLPALVKAVCNTVVALGTEPASPKQPVPAVPVRQSVFPDYIVCLEDGRKLKTLKRHLRVTYGMTPAQYRERWGLPFDYPMAAPNYRLVRSNIAKAIGLGKRREEPTIKRGRGRPRSNKADPVVTAAS